MKIKCDFCKTEYNLDTAPSGPVECAICGHTWTVAVPARRNAFLMFVASLCALMAAAVFAVVVLVRHQANQVQTRPLVATISEIKTVVDAAGAPHFVVSGAVLNQSDEIYGVPDLIIVSHDGDGRVIAQQKFMPSATLLDPGAHAEFSHTLSAPASGVKKITVELTDVGDAQ